MSTKAEELKTEALSLPPDEREDIARTLLESLDGDLGLDPEWYAEMLRRLGEIKSGKAEMVPGEEIIAELEEFQREAIPVPPKGAR
jgi:putative addiction module component (TIGR02574 family)